MVQGKQGQYTLGIQKGQTTTCTTEQGKPGHLERVKLQPTV